MSDLKEKLEKLKEQQEQAKNLFTKLQGAIEFTAGLISESENKEEKVEKPVGKKDK